MTEQMPLNKIMEEAAQKVELPQNGEPFVIISDTAKGQIEQVIQAQNKSDLFLRLYVQSSTTGISFGMALDTRKADDDHYCAVKDINVRIDRISFPYLVNSTVDFVTAEEKSGFQITSPNTELLAQAGSACGSCGGGAGCC